MAKTEIHKLTSERGQPGSEDQKLYVLPHMQILDLGQMQQSGWTCIT
jgi:hypothetical protein